MPKTIDVLYAWVATEPDGGEGVVGADMERMTSLRPFAEKVRRESGCKIQLVRFSQRDDLETLP